MNNRLQQPLLYLVTDFGSDGPYLGQVESVIYNSTSAKIVHLLSNMPKADPYHSSYLLAALYKTIPVKNGYMLVVIDPGVGSERDVLLVETQQMKIIAPDNGVLSGLIRGYEGSVQISCLSEKPVNISASFHARDWFAPVMTQLINQDNVQTRPLSISDIKGFDWTPQLNEICYQDHYGNMMTGLSAAACPTGSILQIKGHHVRYAETFSSVNKDDLFWYGNSMGLVEIAANSNSAAGLLDVSIGERVTILS